MVIRRVLDGARGLMERRSVRLAAVAVTVLVVLGVVATVVLPLLFPPEDVVVPVRETAVTEQTVPASTTPPPTEDTAETPVPSVTEPPGEPGQVTEAQVAAAGLSIPSTTTAAGQDCEGLSYRESMFVWDQCVLDAVERRLEDLYSGRHAVRTAAVRDGWVLADAFEALEAEGVDRFGEEAASDPSYYGSLWSDVEGYDHRTVELHGAQWVRRHLINVRFRVVFNDGSFTTPWTVASFSHVGSQWQVTFTSFCRFLGSERCPPDPRPEVVAATSEDTPPTYEPPDDPFPVEDTAADVVW